MNDDCGEEETRTDKTISSVIKISAKLLNWLTKNLPIVSDISDSITNMLEKRCKRKHKNKKIRLNNIIRNKIGMHDLDDNLKRIAINKTQERRNEIINPPKISVSNSCFSKFQANIKKIVNKVKELMLPKALERHDKDNIAVQLALKDSILFIESLYTNRDDILNEKSDIFFRRR